MARDDFTASTIRKLRDRVAHRCSNPDCRVPTSSPKGDSDVSNIGTAAHICAASPGGARYKASMTKQERSSIKNGIWLCTNCSREIDNDVDLYTEDLLRKWKNTAEATAKQESGKRLPKNDDAIHQMATALSGMPQKSFLSEAISNVHRASSQALENLDSRFSIDSEYKDGVTSFTISAKETVNINIRVEAPHAELFSKKYRDLIESGKDLELATEGISASGSALIRKIMEDSTTLKITSPKKPAIQKMSMIQEDTGIIESLDDAIGEVSLGRHSISFDGLSCSDVFRIQYSLPIDGSHKSTKAKISLQFDEWNGKDIRALPFHQKLLDTFTKFKEGWKMVSSLEIDGLEIFRSDAISFDDSDYLADISSFLYYTELCKKIASTFEKKVNFNSKVSYSKEEHQALARIVSDIESDGYSQEVLQGNISCEMTIHDPDKAREVLLSNETISIKLKQETGESISLFDQTILLPPLTIEQTHVRLKVIGDSSNNIKIGDTITIELIPQENCLSYFRYEI